MNPITTHDIPLDEFIRLYFERSGALQSYWTLYVLIIGGLLAVASLRKQPALVTTALVSVLFACFAYKNLDAIHDVVLQRSAILEAIRLTPGDGVGAKAARELIVPTLVQPEYAGIRNFHVACDALTLAALWAMEVRRRKNRPRVGFEG